jgi:hypothetical protein
MKKTRINEKTRLRARKDTLSQLLNKRQRWMYWQLKSKRTSTTAQSPEKQWWSTTRCWLLCNATWVTTP